MRVASLLLLAACAVPGYEAMAETPLSASPEASCPAGSVYRVRMSAALASVDRTTFERAIRMWSEEVLTTSFVYTVETAVDVRAEHVPCVVNVVLRPDPPFYGKTTPRIDAEDLRTASAIVYLSPGAWDERTRFAGAMHEVGHVLGLGHEEDPSAASVMRRLIPGDETAGRLGCQDARAACERWGCETRCEEGWL